MFHLSRHYQPMERLGGYAPGLYDCRCLICGSTFLGAKRAFQCHPCAVKISDEQVTNNLGSGI